MKHFTLFILFMLISCYTQRNCYTFQELESENYTDYFPKLQNYYNTEIVQAVRNFDKNIHSGKGGNGEVKIVYLQQKIRGDAKLAIKKVTKQKPRSKVILHAEDEVAQWLQVMDSPYVPGLYACFEAETNSETNPTNTFFLIQTPLEFDLDQKPGSVDTVNYKFIKDALPSQTDRIWFYYRLFVAIQDIHNLRLVHNDIKPSNIMLGPHGYKGKPFLVDFGSADEIYSQPHASTPCFEYKNKKKVGINHPAFDVFSAGVTVLELETSFYKFCIAYNVSFDRKNYNAMDPAPELVEGFYKLFYLALDIQNSYLYLGDVSRCENLNCIIEFCVQSNINNIPSAQAVSQALLRLYKNLKKKEEILSLF